MRRRVSLVLGGVVIVFLAAVMASTMGATTQEVRPSDVVNGSYDGEHVTLKGRIGTIKQFNDPVIFTVKGYNASVTVRWKGSVGTTFREGKFVIVEGTMKDGTLVATRKPMVRAHLNEDRPGAGQS